MIDRRGRLGDRLAAVTVGAGRRPRLVLALSFAALVPLAVYAWTHLRVDANTGNLVSDRLPWKQANAALEEAFPHLFDDMQIVIDARSPAIAAAVQERMADRLTEQADLFSLVYAPGAGDYFERSALLFTSAGELRDLRDRMREYGPLWRDLEADPSLNGLAAAIDRIASDSALAVPLEPILLGVGGAFYSSRSGSYFVFPWSELIRGRRAGTAELRRFILVKPILDYSRTRPAGPAMTAIREAAGAIDLDPRGFRVRVTGAEAFEHESIDSGLSDIPRLVAGALVLVSIILLLALRSVRLLAACLVVLFAGLAGTAAFAALAVGELNMISVAFAVLYVGLGIDYAIHFSLGYVEARRESDSHLEALGDTARRAGVALFLSAVTTAFCFYVFMVTDFTGIADLGRIGGTGMLISFTVTLVLLPALLSVRPFRLAALDPGSAPPDESGSDPGFEATGHRAMAWLDRAVRNRRRPILAGALVLAVGSALLVPRVRFDQDVINMSDPDAESVVTLHELLDDPNTAVRAVSMMEPDSARAATVAGHLEALHVVRGTLTLNTFVPTDQEPKLAIIERIAADLGPVPDRVAQETEVAEDGRTAYRARLAAVGRLRDTASRLYLDGDSATSAAAGQLLFLIDTWRSSLEQWPDSTRHSIAAGLEESLVGSLPAVQRSFRKALQARPVTRASLPASLRERWVTEEGVERVQVLPADRLDTPAKLREFVEAVQAEEPAITGMPVENLELGKVTVNAFRLAFGLALLATAVTLLLLLGDVRASAVVMTSLILATLLTGAAAVVWDIPFNISNIITLPLLLGIGVDAGIHIVHRRRQASPGDLALLDTATGRAILYSAVTTMAGFGSLTLASHRAISGMGALLLIGMMSVLLCTLIVLPAIMARRRA